MTVATLQKLAKRVGQFRQRRRGLFLPRRHAFWRNHRWVEEDGALHLGPDLAERYLALAREHRDLTGKWPETDPDKQVSTSPELEAWLADLCRRIREEGLQAVDPPNREELSAEERDDLRRAIRTLEIAIELHSVVQEAWSREGCWVVRREPR
jgi:hypothetical protein